MTNPNVLAYPGWEANWPEFKPGAVRFVCELPYGAKVVGMTTCNGRVYVATEDGVYWVDGETLRRIELAPTT